MSVGLNLKIPLAKPVFDEEMRDAALDALRGEGWVLGESVFRFEEEFARYCGARFAVSTGSGTSALQLSLLALDVKRGDRVVTSPASFVATANVALHVNAQGQRRVSLRASFGHPISVGRKLGEMNA